MALGFEILSGRTLLWTMRMIVMKNGKRYSSLNLFGKSICSIFINFLTMLKFFRKIPGKVFLTMTRMMRKKRMRLTQISLNMRKMMTVMGFL